MPERVFGFSTNPPVIWKPSQYAGQPVVAVAATQLDDKGLNASERRRVLAEWIEFFRTARTTIAELQLVSRVPQELLDSVAGQPQLTALWVKWGPYRDITAVGELEQLTTLRLAGATGLERLDPLLALPRLSMLAVSEAHRLGGVSVLGDLTGLTSLVFGNEHLGSDKSVVVPDLEWVRTLGQLRSLSLPGTRLLNPDLSPILALATLEELHLPLRRHYRKQVFEYATSSAVFAQVAREYESYETWRESHRS